MELKRKNSILSEVSTIARQKFTNFFFFNWENYCKHGKTISIIIDPKLNDSSRDEIMRCIHIGLLCVRENIPDRPIVTSVVLMLDSYPLALPIPWHPAFVLHATTSSNILTIQCSLEQIYRDSVFDFFRGESQNSNKKFVTVCPQPLGTQSTAFIFEKGFLFGRT